MNNGIKLTLVLSILFVGYGCSNKGSSDKKNPNTDTTSQNQNNKTDQHPNDTTWINEIHFGYSNEKGDLILLDSAIYPLKPEQLAYSIDSSGRQITIGFDKFRAPSNKDNGRQSYFNFDNAGGYLYKSNGINPESTSILFTQNFINQRSMVKIYPTGSKGMPDEVKKKIETDKNRKIKNSQEMVTLDGGGNIYLMEFGRKKDSALASIVLVYQNNYTYYDFPALYDEQSTWRVDDGGEFWLDGIEILVAFKKDDQLELIFDWVGAEGYNTQYLQQNGSVFKEIKTNYRYTAPI